jgi:hypothetical protein
MNWVNKALGGMVLRISPDCPGYYINDAAGTRFPNNCSLRKYDGKNVICSFVVMLV